MLEETRRKVGAWRLPWRVPVPKRDDLIAMGLMALALGLMVGVAIGPVLGSSGSAASTVVLPAPAEAVDTPEIEDTVAEAAGAPPLGSPAGSKVPEPAAGPAPRQVASTVTTPPASPAPTPAADPAPSSDPVDETADPEVDNFVPPARDPSSPGETPAGVTGSPLAATVVGVGREATSYSAVDEFGNLLGLHGTALPPVSSRISNRIEPLANGTFGETVGWTSRGERGDAPIRGVVSYLDPANGWIVVSGRGVSVAIDAAATLASGDLPVVAGSQVEGRVRFFKDRFDDPEAGPLLGAKALTAVGDPGQVLELNGSLLTADSKTRRLTMAPDSGGRIEGEIEINTPKDFDPATAKLGKTYNATAEADEDGNLRLTGLSLDGDVAAADDVSAAYGDHRVG